MKKTKKTRNGGKIRGGKSFLERLTPFNANVSGPFVADDIDMNVRYKNKVGLLNEYETRKKDSEKQYQEIERKFNENHKQKLEEDNLSFKFRQESNLQWNRFLHIMGAIYTASVNLVTIIVSAIWKVIEFFTSLGGSLGGKISDFLGSLSKSTILNTLFRVIIVIGFILIIIFGSLGFFSSNSSGSSGDSSDSIGDRMNAYGEQISSMASGNNNLFIKTPEPPSIYGLLSSSLQSMIPEKYRITFTAFRNNVNSVFGNDLVETSIHNRPREVIKNGRYDDIFHINIENNNEKIYTMVKPKDIEIKIKYDNIANSADLNKLPDKIKEKYKNNFKKLIIDAKASENGSFIFPTKDIKYEDKSGNKIKLTADNIENPFEDVINDKFPLKEFNMKDYIYNKLMTNNVNALMKDKKEYPPSYITSLNNNDVNILYKVRNILESKTKKIT